MIYAYRIHPQEMEVNEDRFKDAGQFEPKKAWSRITTQRSRDRAAARVMSGDRAYTGGMLAALFLLLLIALGSLGWWIFG